MMENEENKMTEVKTKAKEYLMKIEGGYREPSKIVLALPNKLFNKPT